MSRFCHNTAGRKGGRWLLMDGFVRRGSDEVGGGSQHLRGAHDPGGRSLPRLPSLSLNELSALAAIFARPATLISRLPGLGDGFAAGLL
jgi:hypothetical protein